jgi:hypothetical protein
MDRFGGKQNRPAVFAVDGLGGIGRHMLIVLARLGGMGRGSGSQRKDDTDAGNRQLEGERCSRILASSRYSLF